MSVNRKLDDALAIFCELGWEGATLADTPTLPTGTPEQRRKAVQGLASGEWELFETAPWAGRRHIFTGYRDPHGVDHDLLGIFAVRMGVNARRAAMVLPCRDLPAQLAEDILAPRGPEFATSFIAAACRPSARMWVGNLIPHSAVAVRLVTRFGLPAPDHVAYLASWARHLDAAFRGEPAPETATTHFDPAFFRPRFEEHLERAAALGVPVFASYEPLGKVVRAAWRAGWLTREGYLTAGIAGLEGAGRPGDRKTWAQLLTGDLEVTPEEMRPHVDAFVPILARGEAAVMRPLLPMVTAAARVDQLADVALTALSSSTNTVLKVALECLLARDDADAEAAGAVADRLAELTAGRDKKVAQLAGRLATTWHIADPTAPAEVEEPVIPWLPTPDLWQVPRFERGAATRDALIASGILMLSTELEYADPDVERFLALTNELARHDPASARACLGAFQQDPTSTLRSVVAAWVRAERYEWREYGRPRALDPSFERVAQVVPRFGELPFLLSEPSTVDLRITPADLVARLRAYADEGVAVCEADLFLALLRLDAARADAADREALRGMGKIEVRLRSGEVMAPDAAALVLGYLEDPIVEPILTTSKETEGTWWCVAATLTPPASLAAFPDRLELYTEHRHFAPTPDAFPTWGDAALTWVVRDEFSGQMAGTWGRIVRQAARRATPLPPGGAVNMLAQASQCHPAAAENSLTAVAEAWQRGLLRPGVADVALLDWRTDPPRNITALAHTLADHAAAGMLSVVWPVLDDLLLASVTATRMFAGTADVVDVVAGLAPSVAAAIADGSAPADAANVPGVRAIAAKAGNSAAVKSARAAVALLPSAAAPPPTTAPVFDFDAVWPEGAGETPAPEAPGQVDVAWRHTDAGWAPEITLQLPGLADGITRWRMRALWANTFWTTPLDLPQGAAGERTPEFRLIWHADRQAYEAFLGYTGDTWLRSTPPYPALLVAFLLWDSQKWRINEFHTALLDGRFGWRALDEALTMYAAPEGFNPSGVLRLIADDPTTLPALWAVLTHGIRVAAIAEKPPSWLNRCLDIALHYAPLLREAASRSRISSDHATWPGLTDIAARTAKTKAVAKARDLQAALGLADR